MSRSQITINAARRARAEDRLVAGRLSPPDVRRGIRYSPERRRTRRDLENLAETLQDANAALKKVIYQLEALSVTDSLTGLYNRRGFMILGEQLLKIANRNRSPMAILFGDLNGMKKINDSFGHQEGDRALLDTAEIFRRTFRESDILSRIGGDEFVVLASAGKREGEAICCRLQANVCAQNRAAGRSYEISISVGMAMYDPTHPQSLEDVLSSADKAMYEQKKALQSREPSL